MATVRDTIALGRRVDAHRPWPRVVVTDGAVALDRVRACRRARDAARPLGRAARRDTWPCSWSRPTSRWSTVECADGQFPSVGALHAPAIRLERAIHDLYGLEPRGALDTRPWLDLGFWDVQHPLGDRSDAPTARAALSVPADRRRKPAPDSGRAGACRHHRARPFPLHRQRRDRGAARTAPGLCAQRHRIADDRRVAREGGAARGPHLRRQHGRLCAGLRPRRRSRARHRRAAARARSARADGGARAARQPFRRHRRDLQRRLVLDHARAMRHPARAHLAHGGGLLRPPADDGPGGAGRRRGRSRRGRRRSPALAA